MRPFSNKVRRFACYRLPVIALCLAIFWQSSRPGLIQAPLFPHDDKVMHVTVYAILAALTARDLAHRRPGFSGLKLWLAAILFSSLYGLSDELHQAFVPQRAADIFDFMADILGSIAGTWLYLYLYETRFKRDR